MLGALLREGTLGLAKDEALGAQLIARAVVLWREQCDTDDARACTRVGAIAALDAVNRLGAGADSPYAQSCLGRAALLLERGCEGGHTEACELASGLYEAHLGLPRDARRVAELFERGCQARRPMSCLLIGDLYRRGDGVPKDATAASQRYEVGCAGSPARQGEWGVVARACSRLGYGYLTGVGSLTDRRRAEALLLRVCDGGDRRLEDAYDRMGRAEGCLYAGLLYETSHDPWRAAEFYRKSCDASHPERLGCDELTRVTEALR
jgi:TPR repeat protein